MRLVDLLAPGVTTVTPHGRYYALHARVAVEAERRALSTRDALSLLRRCEVVVGGVSILHESQHHGLAKPHGVDVLAPRLRAENELVLEEASQYGRGQYAGSERGFWAAYGGSEIQLGIIPPGSHPTPGERCDAAAVSAGLDGLLELATKDRVTSTQLRDAEHLCVCRGSQRADGVWLRHLLCDEPDDASKTRNLDRARRGTIQLLGRVVAAEAPADFGSAYRMRVPFGDFVDEDPVARLLDVSPVWRGALLRRYSVGAWRRVWAWLVDQVDGLVMPQAIAQTFADALPDTKITSFTSALPATIDAHGATLPAEEQVRMSNWNPPTRELAVLALGGQRLAELDGPTLDAFAGRPIELAPVWMARRLEIWKDRSIRDFGHTLIADLITRSKRVAMSKLRRRPDGTLWLPTRLFERGDFLWRTSREGAGDVAIRIDQLGLVLAEAGVLEYADNAWRLSAAGKELLA
jgi:hypothetical protein